jgi:terminase large subunit-like protein
MEMHGNLGLNLSTASNWVEARIIEVYDLLISGRLKVMASLENWLREFRKYHRDDKGAGQNRQAIRPPDGRHAIPDGQWTPLHGHEAPTSASEPLSRERLVVNASIRTDVSRPTLGQQQLAANEKARGAWPQARFCPFYDFAYALLRRRIAVIRPVRPRARTP